MNPGERPPQPDPRCIWNEEHQVWVWPDDRTPTQQAADEEIAQGAESEPWDLEEFLKRHPIQPAPKT